MIEYLLTTLLYTHSPLLYTGLKWAEREKIRVKWCQTAPFFCIFTRKSDATAHTGFEQTSLTFLKSVEKLAFPCFHALLFYKPWFQCPMVCFSRVRVARAFPGILTFSLSQPSQKSTTTYLVPLPRVTHTWCDLRKAKTAFFDTKLTILLKIVRKTRVILCNTTHYRQIGEGCESKNINFAVRTRARRSQIRGD